MSTRHPKHAPFVLVVDDIEDNRDMYAEYLRYTGYRVDCAENGEVALEMARTLGPLVIVMDLSLPILDGWEATRILKADPMTKDIWIIAVTGHGEPHYIERATVAGVDDFALKPLTPNQLAEKVAAGLARRKKKR